MTSTEISVSPGFVPTKIDTSLQKYFSEIPIGIQEDMLYDNYFRLPAINCSAIKYGMRSAYHMDKYLIGALKEEKKEYNFGNYFHLLVFEEEKFYKFCYVLPAPATPNGAGEYRWDKRLKAHKEFYAECIETAGSREIIPKEDFDKMQIMRDAIASHQKIYDALVAIKGYTETIVLWKNKDLGINCKGKFDKFIPNNFICDLKTTKDASPYGFLRDFDRYLYKVQAAIYTDALDAIGYGDLPFIFIALEHSPPYFCKIYEVSPEKINEGRQIYVKKLQEYIDYKNNVVDLSDVYVI